MSITYLPETGYVTMPWKNGNGSTDEICLLPAGATRDEFQLRVSRATISEIGLFSPFAGVERVITLVEGKGLTLEFHDHSIELTAGRPERFDSGLTPLGNPKAGSVRVVNVMAARNNWEFEQASVVTRSQTLLPGKGGMIVVYALRGDAHLSEGDSSLALVQGDSALLSGATVISLSDQAAVLAVPLRPVI